MKKRKELTKFRTASEAGMEFAKEGIKTKEAIGKMGAFDVSPEELEADPTMQVLRAREKAYSDSSRMLANIQANPDVFGKNPNVDQIFAMTSQFEDAERKFSTEVPVLAEQILAKMGQSGQEFPAGEYYQRKAVEIAEQAVAQQIEADYGYSFDDIMSYLELIKR